MNIKEHIPHFVKEHKKAIEENKITMTIYKKQLTEKDDEIKKLASKPSTNGFKRDIGYVYMIMDTNIFGVYKIGYTDNIKQRIK